MRWGIALAGSLVTLVFARRAAADCAEPISYVSQVQGATVVVSIQGPGPFPSCPGAALLRQDVATGEVVTLGGPNSPIICTDAGCAGPYCTDAGSWVDECVPTRTYNYGLATPIPCCGACCGTDYYGTVTVFATGGDGGACVRSVGDIGPMEGGTVPWGSSQQECGYSGSGPGGSSGSGSSGSSSGASSSGGSDSGGGSPIDAGAPGTDAGGNGETAGGGHSGCSCSAVSAVRGGVVALDAVAVAAGGAILLRRRRRK
jgi:hypothetical protein